MSTPATPTLRLTGTLVAQYFRFGCDRQLRWEIVPSHLRGGVVPAPNSDPSRGPRVGVRPGMGLLSQAGRRWERRVIRRLIRRFGSETVLTAGHDEAGDAARLPYAEVVRALREPGEARFLVQPELRLPHTLAQRYGLDPMLVVAPAQPDLILIRRGRDGRVRLGIADIKWSREGTVQHYAQVAFYSLLLEEICRAEGIAGRVESRWGWLWSRGMRRPRRFPLTAYRHHVEDFLRADLPRVAATSPEAAAWHVGARCASCPFFDHCRDEAERSDDLSRVYGLTPLAKRTLHQKGIRTVRELSRKGFARDVYTGCHALEAGEAVLKKRVQALAFGKLFDVEKQTHLMGDGERVRVLLCAEGDPVSGTVFALGMRVEPRGEAEVFLSGAGTEEAERAMLGEFLLRVGAVVAGAGAAEAGGRKREKAVHLYLYDRQELKLLRELLERHLGDPAAQPAVAAILGLLFPAGEGGRGGAAPGSVVLDTIKELLALPLPHAWDLASVSAVLQPASGACVYRPRADYGWPLSGQVAYERIHNVWSRRPHRAAEESPDRVREEICATVRSKLAALDSVVRAVREQASKRGESRLRMDPGAGSSAGAVEGPLADALLEKLRVFVRMEATAASLAVRNLHTLPTRERVRRFECVSGLERVEVLPNGHAVFEFDPACREAKFRPGDFALLLTNDDGRSLLETDRRPWLQRRRMVELVEYDLAAEPPRVVLASDYGWDRMEAEGLIDFGRVCVLDRAETDFNTRRVVATLGHLAEGHGEAAFVRELLEGREPEGWLAPLDPDAGWADSVALAAKQYGREVLNAEQAAAWRAVFERAVSIVWGPPGTGKTYLLAWMLVGAAAAARRQGRPLRILVTSATHRAVVNVLARLAKELVGSGIPSPLRAVKLAGPGSEADADLDGLPVEVVGDARLESVLREAEATGLPVVVGSTVWSLWKQMRAMNRADADDGASADAPIRPLFDVVVVDEASQLRVPDALIALSSIRRGGRVVLCGDDRQLPPILHGSYPGEDTLFGSIFSHLAERFGRVALRESRRMNRALVRYPRRVFYPGLVSTVPEQRLRLRDVDRGDLLDAQLWDVFFRPEDAVVLCTYDGYRSTARNPFEAALVARIARLAREGMADPRTGERYSAAAFRSQALAIISPHRAQNSAILGELAALGWPREELPVVDTVERMQGNERELIVVSYAVADREYAEREAEFLLSPNRFNVSITRPRSKLIVFLSEEVLRVVPGDERVMTDSMAIKGYLRHCGPAVREVELPAPDGTKVRLRVRVRGMG